MTDPRFAKLVVLVNCAVPMVCLCWDARRHQLGANPGNYALLTTGMLALIFLMLTLAITPARKLLGRNFLSHFRRLLGLAAFFYACMHFLIYVAVDRSFELSGTLADIIARPFILVGMTGLLAMTPLAITSTDNMIKRMGGLWWKRLHRLVYLAATAGVLHYWLLVKADTRQPLAFAIVLAVLLAYRVAGKYLRPRKGRPPRFSGTPGSSGTPGTPGSLGNPGNAGSQKEATAS